MNRVVNAGTYQVLPDEEYIFVVSDTLRSALTEVGTCSPFDCDTDGEMMAPYLFVYHHRQALQEYADQKQGDYASHITSLLSYIENRYGRDYEDADAKFAKGIVTPEHVTKLWIPNQILIAKKDGHDCAYVLKSWPTEHHRRSYERGTRKDLELRCWSWEYDGASLKRQEQFQKVNLASHDEIAINKLSIYPHRFALGHLQTMLKTRGRKFWGFRQKHLVNYSGDDFNKETIYVRYLRRARVAKLTVA